MRILFCSKYPPIQGGESAKAYWLAEALAQKGHEVTVITNAFEVEPAYEIKLEQAGLDVLLKSRVKLRSTLQIGVPRFIPRTNPYCEKLLSICLEEHETRRFDLIFAWYLLPYGVAALTASCLTGVPYCVRHAGSDVTRLLAHPYLNRILLQVLTSASGVFTSGRIQGYLRELGCRRTFATPTVPAAEFSPIGESANLYDEFGVTADPGKCALFLGKLSRGKGAQQLFAAAELVQHSCILVAGAGEELTDYKAALSGHLSKSVMFIGAVPPWRVPSLMRAVRAVIVPEYNFGVAPHRSAIPLEAVLCGTPVLISDQIAGHYGDVSKLLRPVNVTDRRELARAIDDAVASPKLAVESCRDARRSVGVFEDHVAAIEQQLKSVLQ
ncbi:glycosyltransferase family 1 protein [Rhizobium sp. Kim5]|uniref:glycosyltransferase n=1 Tax=Rhizobium sp. Kim5 TaxID=2020311 RepID=UPI0002EF7513|nr:glycosyltransferase [Rhizobium sp. Kim5]ARQ58947.1 glycosyltransferase family 1 protein [Rhizobium sp. Kim5]